VDSCPTGFSNDGTNCTLDDNVIVSILFESITMTYTNSIAGISLNISVEQTDSDSGNDKRPSVYPSKYRGVYFDGDNSSTIKVESYEMNFEFSIHAWILTINDKTVQAVYSKHMSDRTLVVQAFINENDEMDIGLLNDNGDQMCGKSVGAATITEITWTYAVWSVTVAKGSEINFEAFINEVSMGTQNDMCTGAAIVYDSTQYPAYIGTEYDFSTSKYKNTFNGFIYFLAVSQSGYVKADYNFYTETCASGAGCAN
jgi:hypothetical protein